jgi:hypothetical protein
MDLTKEEQKVFDRHYTKCEFNDECGSCDNPTNGSYATGYDTYTGEVDDYVCGSCAVKSIPNIVEMEKKEYAAIEEIWNSI